MKFFISFGYIIIITLITVASLKLSRVTTQGTFKGKVPVQKAFFYSLVIQLLMFGLFALLIQKFPIYLTAGLAIASTCVVFLTTTLVSAFIGVSSYSTQEKVKTLNILMHFNAGFVQKWRAHIPTILGLLVFACWAAALIIYWINPIDLWKVQMYLALFTFVIPILLGYVTETFSSMFVITSPDADDDLRNQRLVLGLPNTVNVAIWLAYPIWIISDSYPELKETFLPNWILVSIPLGIFFLLNVIPHFIGSYNYRHTSKILSTERKDLLSRLVSCSELPLNETSKAIKNEILIDLRNEVALQEKHSNSRTVINQLSAASEEELSIARQQVQDFDTIIEFVKGNISKLSKWDITLAHILKLEEYQRVTSSDEINKFTNYYKTNLQSENEYLTSIKSEKNIFVGLFVTGLISLFTIASKYLDDWIPNVFSFIRDF